MKRLILVFLLIVSQVSLAQWEPCNNGISGAFVRCLLNNNGNLIVGTAKGIFVSLDSGSTWTQKSLEKFNLEILCLTANGNKIYAGTIGYGLYYSNDNGNTWNKSELFDDYLDIYSVITRDDIVILGTPAGFYISSNQGEKWIKKYTISSIRELILTERNVIITSNGRKIHKSTDWGDTWVTVYECDSYTYITKISTFGKIVFAGSFSGDLLLSSDDGNTWSEYYGEFTRSGNRVNSIYRDSDNIWLATKNGLYFSADLGIHWTYNNSPDYLINIQSVSKYDNLLYIGTSGYGIYSGNSWKSINHGLDNIYITTLTISPERVYLGTTYSGLFSSDDNGNDWNDLSENITKKGIACILTFGKNLYVSFEGKIFFSDDNGTNWTPKDSGLSQKYVNSLSGEESNLYAGTSAGVYHSTNNGEVWVLKDKGIEKANVEKILVNKDKIFAKTQKGLFKSTDSANNWTLVDLGYLIPSLGAITMNDDLIVLSQNNRFFISTNNGEFWIPRGISWKNSEINAFSIIGDKILAGTKTEGIYISKDSCFSWYQINEGLTNLNVTVIGTDNSKIYAGTFGNGIYRAKLTDFGITNIIEKSETEGTVSLSPNPATDFIDVSVGANGRSPLQSDVRIYNIFGQIVSTPVCSSDTPASGGHVRIDVSDLAPGMYFVRIGNKASKFIKI